MIQHKLLAAGMTTLLLGFSPLGAAPSREGFGLGLGLGGAYEVLHDKTPGFAFDLELAYGVSDQLILTYNPLGTLLIARNRGENEVSGIWGLEVGARYFFERDRSPYISLAAGYSYLTTSSSVASSVLGISAKYPTGGGFSFSTAAGYEWPLGEAFALSGELLFHFMRTKGTNLLWISPAASAVWYF